MRYLGLLLEAVFVEHSQDLSYSSSAHSAFHPQATWLAEGVDSMLLVVAVGVEARDKASGPCMQMRFEHVCGESCLFMGDCSTSSSGVHEKELGCLKG